jgi:hypothetical protein
MNQGIALPGSGISSRSQAFWIFAWDASPCQLQAGNGWAIFRLDRRQFFRRPALLAEPKNMQERHTETEIVVEVVWLVPVAAGAAGVVSIVVPRTATHHPGSQQPFPFNPLY